MTAGSPWRVNVSSPAQISMTGAGLKSVPVHKPTTFEVRTGLSHDYGNLVANILCEYTCSHDDVLSLNNAFDSFEILCVIGTDHVGQMYR